MNFKCWPKQHHKAFVQRRRKAFFCSHGQKKVGTVPNYQPMINRGYQAYDSVNIYDMSYCLVIVALVIFIFLHFLYQNINLMKNWNISYTVNISLHIILVGK